MKKWSHAGRLRKSTYGEEKLCTTCDEWLPTDCFTSHPKGAGGLDNRCNACRVDYRRARAA